MAKCRGHKHAAVLLLLAYLLAAFLFPVVLSAVHQHHHCTVQDCPVCALIHSAHDFFTRLLLALGVALAAILAAGPVFWGRAAFDNRLFAWGSTPVSLRVRLNN